ncbi:ATP synthase subunit I [uncultured Jatrophihabitans sp.]|uniref:ATP synthase subunit I n=1 Tax=uncultured Jatrophihabitans sp. TaxID=1610747 RepID=UPI0035CB9111
MEPGVYTPTSAVVNLRRSSLISAGLTVLAVAVCSLAGHPLMGVFFGLGLGLGAVNNKLLQRSVIARASGDASKRAFGGGVLMRLGAITLVAFALVLLVRPDGLGVFAGLAVFQVLMLVGAALPVFRSLRPSA